jgi:hypothetical protein
MQQPYCGQAVPHVNQNEKYFPIFSIFIENSKFKFIFVPAKERTAEDDKLSQTVAL